MTTTQDTPRTEPVDPGSRLDLSGRQPAPFGRLVTVELRKVFDTRSGRWLTGAIVGLTVLALVLAGFAFPEDAQEYSEMLSLSGGLMGYFLPLLTILLVTSEWSQRTALTTFSLEPRRSRVVAAKLVTGLGLAVVVLAIGAALAAAAMPLTLANGGDMVWNLSWHQVQSFVVSSLVGVLVGFVLALLLRSSPAAIVGYFVYTAVLSSVMGVLSALVDGFDEVAPWIEFNTAQTPLISGDYTASGEQWLQILVTGLVWVVLPFVVGVRRLLRAEVK